MKTITPTTEQNEANKKGIIVIRIFSWRLLCQHPCSHSEPQPTPASPGGPPVPLGRSLDLPWALWGTQTLT